MKTEDQKTTKSKLTNYLLCGKIKVSPRVHKKIPAVRRTPPIKIRLKFVLDLLLQCLHSKKTTTWMRRFAWGGGSRGRCCWPSSPPAPRGQMMIWTLFSLKIRHLPVKKSARFYELKSAKGLGNHYSCTFFHVKSLLHHVSIHSIRFTFCWSFSLFKNTVQLL